MKTIFCCMLTSRRVAALDFSLIVNACRTQLVDDFAPAWGRQPADVQIWTPGKPLPADTAAIRYVASRFRDATRDDPQDALAYHWVADNGRPEVVVLCDVILSQRGAIRDDVCTGAGHEFIETEGDEFANEWSDRGDGTEEVHELVDRVQGSSYPRNIMVSGVPHRIRLTNFLLPQSFNDQAPPGSKFDFCGHLKHARDIEPNGYTVTRPVGGGEKAVMGNVKAARAFSCKTLERHGVRHQPTTKRRHP